MASMVGVTTSHAQNIGSQSFYFKRHYNKGLKGAGGFYKDIVSYLSKALKIRVNLHAINAFFAESTIASHIDNNKNGKKKGRVMISFNPHEINNNLSWRTIDNVVTKDQVTIHFHEMVPFQDFHWRPSVGKPLVNVLLNMRGTYNEEVVAKKHHRVSYRHSLR